MNYLPEAASLIITIIIAKIHAERYDNNVPIGGWWHLLWLLPFVGVAIVGWFTSHNWQLSVSVILIRGVTFSPILNFMRKKISAKGFMDRFFYLHGESSNGSWWDKQLEKTKKIYPYIWCAGFIFLIILQFFL